MPSIFSLIISTAIAGPLADGYKGVKWGAYKTFPAPTTNCGEGNEEGIAWVCEQNIGEVTVDVAYAYYHEIFYAVVVVGGSYSDCSYLMSTFESGWGESAPQSEFLTGRMDKRIWRDEEVFAAFDYTQYTTNCEIYMINSALMTKMEAIEKAQAAKGAADL